ncbi:MAG TPA: hypothetical protein VKX46_21180, partial [Ktedonobacteraceae bacterium]|nr:hypothetical protein [Ktedonobacteraceae bacterium]
KSLDLVRWALVAQVVASFLCWFLGQNFFWRAPSDVGAHSWTLRLLMPFLLYSFPYVILIVSFLTRPENRTLIYSLVVPAVLTLPTVVNLAVLAAVYIRHPAGFLLLFLPWSLHIVIMVLAWKAIRKIGLQPDGPALFRSGIVTCAYFFVIHLISPFFYLFLGR